MSEPVYTPSSGVIFRFDERGDIVASLGLSSLPARVPRGALDLLRAFAGGATPTEARARLEAEGILVPDDHLKRGISGLVDRGFLLTGCGAGDRRSRAPEGWFGTPQIQFAMLDDLARVLAYRAAIARVCAGRRVVDLGTGTGVLAVFAAQAGATHVDAIEETSMAWIAREVVADNGVSDIVEVHARHSRDVTLAEPADVLIHELIGADIVGENLLPTIADAKARLLRPDGILLPSCLEVCAVGVDLGVDVETRRSDLLSRIDELGRLYGVRLGALARSLERADAASLLPPIETTRDGRFALRVLTEEVRVVVFDFASAQPPSLPVTFRLRAVTTGHLGGVFLFFRARLDDHGQLTNAPAAPPTSWGHRVHPLRAGQPVEAGATLEFRVWLEERAGRQRLVVGGA